MNTILRKVSIFTLSIFLLVIAFSALSNSVMAQQPTAVFQPTAVPAVCPQSGATGYSNLTVCDQVKTADLGFNIPSLADILTFIIRGFFVIAGLAALLFMLLGAFAWVTSSGEKDAVAKAQQKIQAAVVGVIMIIVVLSIIWTLENIVFNKRICVGLTCPVTIPGLLTSNSGTNCCICAPKTTKPGIAVDVFAGGVCN